MIAHCGLPTQDFDDAMVSAAFAADKQRDPAQRKQMLDQLNAQYKLYDAKITMVGVRDTVGALGVPALWGGVDDGAGVVHRSALRRGRELQR